MHPRLDFPPSPSLCLPPAMQVRWAWHGPPSVLTSPAKLPCPSRPVPSFSGTVAQRGAGACMHANVIADLAGRPCPRAFDRPTLKSQHELRWLFLVQNTHRPALAYMVLTYPDWAAACRLGLEVQKYPPAGLFYGSHGGFETSYEITRLRDRWL